MNEFVLSADLGGTNIRIAAVGDKGGISNLLKRKTPNRQKREDLVKTIVRIAEECLGQVGSGPAAISLAIPATIDLATGIVKKAPNLPELNRFDLGAEISRHFDPVPVFVENDANAAAVGENWIGASAGFSNSIMVTLGTGVGGGIIIDGKLLRGADGMAGEIGHINVIPEGILCGCGSRGCLEQYASATALNRMALESGFELSADSSVTAESKVIFDRAVNGETWALDIFHRQGKYLGIIFGGLINTLNPDVIVVGGGASAAWDLFIDSLKAQVALSAYEDSAARAKIVRAKLGDNAGIIGAAKIGFDKIETLTAAAM